MDKLGIHQVAATLTAGVIANLPDTLELGQPKDNPGLQTMNLVTWEVHRIFYHAIAATLEHADWPAAPDLKIDIDGILSQLTGLLGSGGAAALLPFLQQLIGGIAPKPLPVEPVPNPQP